MDAVYDTIITPLSIDISTGEVITPNAIKNVVREEMQNHDMRVLAVLASNGNYTQIIPKAKQKKEKGMDLPKESKELPEGMDSVLKMFQ